ncbi:hypothetical protein [Streptomyces platensis]|uniref:hypothetical protein n=1 Tax=Streptomyces platensis TaxID=58346 RepID=UPI00378E59F8
MPSDYGQLAKTGLFGTVTIGTMTFSTGWWLLGVSAFAVLAGFTLIRFGFRARRGVGEQ